METEKTKESSVIPPIILFVVNNSDFAHDVTLFHPFLNRTLNNFGMPAGVTVFPEHKDATYMQIIAGIESKPLLIGRTVIEIEANHSDKIPNRIGCSIRHKEITQKETFYHHESIEGVYDDNYEYALNGFTKVIIDNVLPHSKCKVSLFPIEVLDRKQPVITPDSDTIVIDVTNEGTETIENVELLKSLVMS